MATLIKPTDATWLFTEQPEQPCHVACLSVFTPPDDADPHYLRDIVERFRTTRIFAEPFNLIRVPGLIGRLLPAWDKVAAEDIDLDYHFRHSALPAPGGERELGVLVSRLHSQPLDQRRPLWEMHVIEGLEGGRFAIYLKLHHSQFDGMAGVALWNRVMSANPADRTCQPPWAVGMSAHTTVTPQPQSEGATGVVPSVLPALEAVGELLRTSLFRKASDKARGLPFGAPKTILNGRIQGSRRVATQCFAMARVKAVAAEAGVSVNDVFVALCGAALRRYLGEQGKLPTAAMVGGFPVSIRPQGDSSAGNAVTFMHGQLGTDIADPIARLRLVHESASAAKAHLQRMPRAALINYTLMIMAPYLGQVALGLGGYGMPMHNLIISNVPGSPTPQYFNGARLNECYPISLLFNGQALNISVYSTSETFNLAFVGCRTSLPHMQNLARYAADALDELEGALGIPQHRP